MTDAPTRPNSCPNSSLERVLSLIGSHSPSSIAKILQVDRKTIRRKIKELEALGLIRITRANRRVFLYEHLEQPCPNLRTSLDDAPTHAPTPPEAELPVTPRFHNQRAYYRLTSRGYFQGKPVQFGRNQKDTTTIGGHRIEVTGSTLAVLIPGNFYARTPLELRERIKAKADSIVAAFCQKYDSAAVFVKISCQTALPTPEAPAITKELGFFSNAFGHYDRSRGPEREYNAKKETGMDTYELADRHLRMPLLVEELGENQARVVATLQQMNLSIEQVASILIKMHGGMKDA